MILVKYRIIQYIFHDNLKQRNVFELSSLAIFQISFQHQINLRLVFAKGKISFVSCWLKYTFMQGYYSKELRVRGESLSLANLNVFFSSLDDRYILLSVQETVPMDLIWKRRRVLTRARVKAVFCSHGLYTVIGMSLYTNYSYIYINYI